ncbi:hypothetical protein GGH15_003118, partial [Coemansia sp. RSA 562]
MSSSDLEDHIPLSARLGKVAVGSYIGNDSVSSSDDDNVPLAMRTKPLVKRKNESDSESDTPLSSKVKTNGKKAKKDKGTLAVKANGNAK